MNEKYKYNLGIINYNRYIHFDILKIICSLSVIIIHVSAKYYIKSNINSFNFKISFFYNAISRFAVPNFFMISGALFLHRDISFKKMFNKYIKRIFINLLFWSIFFSLYSNSFNLDLNKLINKICKGHDHLWYLYATLELYMIVPFLRELSKNENLIKAFLYISFIFTFIIPNFKDVIYYCSKLLYNLLNYINSKLTLHYLKGNIFYFLLGYYLNCKIKINIYKEIIFYFFGILGFCFNTIILFRICIIQQKKLLKYFRALNLHILAFSISIFILAKIQFQKLNFIKNNIIIIISNYTFGIYFFFNIIFTFD